MKPFLAIVTTTPENRVAKYQDFDTFAEAKSHVEAVFDRFPKAFAASNPGGGFADWRVDTNAGTAVFDPPPPPPPPPPPREEVLADALDNAPNDTARWALMAAHFRRSP